MLTIIEVNLEILPIIQNPQIIEDGKKPTIIRVCLSWTDDSYDRQFICNLYINNYNLV